MYANNEDCPDCGDMQACLSLCCSDVPGGEWIHFQGKQLCHFHYSPFPQGQLFMKRICSSWSKFFPLIVDLFRRASFPWETNRISQ